MWARVTMRLAPPPVITLEAVAVARCCAVRRVRVDEVRRPDHDRPWHDDDWRRVGGDRPVRVWRCVDNGWAREVDGAGGHERHVADRDARLSVRSDRKRPAEILRERWGRRKGGDAGEKC